MTTVLPRRATGRPSLGPRHTFAVRLPLELAEKVAKDAEDSSYAAVLAEIVAKHYGYTEPATADGTPEDPYEQEQMPLSA